MRDWIAGPVARMPAVAVVGLVSILVVAPLRAQDVECDVGRVEVRSLRFQGNRTFSDDDLSARVLTTPSSFAKRYLRIIGTPRCYPSDGLQADVRNLTLFYRNNGFYEARVDTLVNVLGPKVVGVTFRIDEGQPILIDSLSTSGLDSIANRGDIRGNLQLTPGGRFSPLSMLTDIDSIVTRLRNLGYVHAAVYPAYSVRQRDRRAEVALDVVPGLRARVGAVIVQSASVTNGRPQIDSAVVLRILGFRTGDWYSDHALLDGQRNLYQLGAYRHVGIALDTTRQHADTLADIVVDLREDYMRQIDEQEGWATLDCFRTSVQYTDKNFLHQAHHVDVTGRLSKVGWGTPTNWKISRQNLCYRPLLDADSISSSTVNYYIGATLREPGLFGSHWVPSYSLFSERRGEYKAYLRRTDLGGEAAATRIIGRGMPLRLAYTLEYGQTRAQPTTLCLVFSRCDVPSQEEVQRRLRLGIASASWQRIRTDNVVAPASGTAVGAELRFAEPWLGSDQTLKFVKGTFDGSFYAPIRPEIVLATRLRLGAIGGSTLPPQEERLYAGGATSVRGFQQNELGSVVYLLDANAIRVDSLNDSTFAYSVLPGKRAQRTIPVGGNQLIVTNVELRFRDPFFPTLLQYVLFTDAGEVWSRQPGARRLGFTSLQVTPGAGLRVFSPVGPINVNAGYNPYGSRAAQAYFPDKTGNQPLICVSTAGVAPILVRRVAATNELIQDAAECPATFSPPRSSNFFKKLTLTISIGTGF